MMTRGANSRAGWVKSGLLAATVFVIAAIPVKPHQEAQQLRIFGATVSRVRVDVVVHDDDRFVDDLRADDFRLFEDGEPVEITDVQLVDLVRGRTVSLSATTTGEPPAAADEALTDRAGPSVSRAAPGVEAPSSLGAVIYYVDGPSFSSTTKARFVEAWKRLLDNTRIAVRVPRAAYAIDGVGRLRELVPLTTNHTRLDEAAEALAELALTTPERNENIVEILQLLPPLDSRGAPAGFEGVSSLDPDLAVTRALARARLLETEERAKSLAAYERLTAFCQALSGREGRVALVWVSSGVKGMTGGPYMATLAAYRAEAQAGAAGMGTRRDSEPGQRSEWEISDPDDQIEAAWQRLERTANSANVSIYTLDPSPLVESRALAADPRVRQAGHAVVLSRSELRGSLDGLRDSLRNTAAATGGRSFIHATDLQRALESIDSDNSRFYLLAYAAPRPHADGEYHQIRVEVDRPGVTWRARAGYAHTPESEHAKRNLESALALPGLARAIPIHAGGIRARSSMGSPMLVLAVTAAAAAFGGAPDQTVHGPPLLRAVAVGPNGDTVARIEGTLEVGDSERTFLPYRSTWSLRPGAHEIRVAIADQDSGAVGAQAFEVEIPEMEGWFVSDPALVWDRGNGVNEPVVDVAGPEQDDLTVYLEAYAAQEPLVEGTLRSLSKPETARSSLDLQPWPLGPVSMPERSDGVHWANLRLPPDLTPGMYEIELEVSDSGDRRARFVLRFETLADGGPAFE